MIGMRGMMAICVMWAGMATAQSDSVMNHTKEKKEFVIDAVTGRVRFLIGDSIVVETVNHTFISGEITEGTPGYLSLKIGKNIVTLDADTIIGVEFTESATYNSRRPRWQPDPANRRTLFLPTAQTLGRYEKAYENYYVFFNNFRWGVNQNFELNAGVSLFPSRKLAKGQVFTAGVRNKLYDENGSVRVTAGAQGFRLSTGKSFTFIYLMTAIGNPNGTCVNVGIGNVFGLEERDAYSLSGSIQVRLNERIKLMTEAMVFKKQSQKKISEHLIMGGLRYYVGKNIAVDAGFVNSSDSDIFPKIPVVSFAYAWK